MVTIIKPNVCEYSPDKVTCSNTEHNPEVRRAREKYPAFNSRHEGYAVLLEEVTELQSEVFKKHPTPDDMRKEAIQIGAMAIRFVQDCCEVKE